MTTDTAVLAWHWITSDSKLRDGRQLVIGEHLTMDGEPVLCERGYHGSVLILDALMYAPGSVVCRVEIGGTVAHDNDKLCGTERVALWSVDAEKVLRRFARWCALCVIHMWNAPQIVREFLVSGDETKRAAAWNAACGAAAWAAAGAAAWNAANNELVRLVTLVHEGVAIPDEIAESEYVEAPR